MAMTFVQEQDDELLTVDELHTYLKVPKTTVYHLAQTGQIPAAKVGRHWRFRKRDIDSWLGGAMEVHRNR